MIEYIDLDIDGVLAQCHETALMQFGAYMVPNKPMYQIVNDQANPPGFAWTGDTFWNSFRHDFWADLPKTDLCDPLVQLSVDLVGVENVFIVTRPTANHQSYSGKSQWVSRNLPELKDNLIIATKKYRVEHNSVLVDDSPENLTDWTNSVLVPRPWNGHYSNDDKVLTDLKGLL